MTRLTIYGDFNCPFSALASVRADVLLAAGGYEVEWRAVQHDTAIPVAGEPVEGDTFAELNAEVAKIRELSADDVHLELTVPPFVRTPPRRPPPSRRRVTRPTGCGVVLFAAVWADGRNVGDPAQLDRLGAAGRDDAVAGRWQAEFEALPKPITPSLVLPDGYVSRGLGALARLADLAAAAPSK